MAVMPPGEARSLDHLHRWQALGPVTSLGSVGEGAAGAGDMGAGLTASIMPGAHRAAGR